MRIKIKNPNNVVLGRNLCIAFLYIGILAFMLFSVAGGSAFSPSHYNQLTTEICSKNGLYCLFLFKLLPWLVFALVGYTLYFIYKAFFAKKDKKPKIRAIEFLPAGVQVEYGKQALPVFLPYPETNFSLILTAFHISTKYGPRPMLGFCTLSFTQGDKTFSCEHFSKRPFHFFPQLLDLRSHFAGFQFAVQPKNFSNSLDKSAARTFNVLFQDYMDYGILCRYDKSARFHLFAAGFLLMLPFGFIMFLIKDIISFNDWSVWLIYSLPLLIGGYLICLGVKATRQAKKLERLKRQGSRVR